MHRVEKGMGKGITAGSDIGTIILKEWWQYTYQNHR